VPTFAPITNRAFAGGIKSRYRGCNDFEKPLQRNKVDTPGRNGFYAVNIGLL
jgi:hypothetical protein